MDGNKNVFLDEIMEEVVNYFDLIDVQACSANAEPYKIDNMLSHIKYLLNYDFGCHFQDLEGFLKDHFKDQIGKWFFNSYCKQYFDEWVDKELLAELVDKKQCIMDENLDFLTLKEFRGYMKKKPSIEGKFSKMIISAQCNIDRLIVEYNQALSSYKSEKILMKVNLITMTDKIMGYLNSTKKGNYTISYVIGKFEKDPDYKIWTTDRFLIKILQCYFQNNDKAATLSMLNHTKHSILNSAGIKGSSNTLVYIFGFLVLISIPVTVIYKLQVLTGCKCFLNSRLLLRILKYSLSIRKAENEILISFYSYVYTFNFIRGQFFKMKIRVTDSEK
ncbi:hypothetical protein RF11_09574 [Thelohanellus kitauei]|uniref:Uncharacterized protein n=1 Tax=Thelohanellus kitauei TaxID=669202 RepID=A0A0C2MN45_THEKT|nr:hypothetical protein RF11_09574 [Thelohanellus kitauei]